MSIDRHFFLRPNKLEKVCKIVTLRVCLNLKLINNVKKTIRNEFSIVRFSPPQKNSNFRRMLALTSPQIRLTLVPANGLILDLTQMKKKKITQQITLSINFWMESVRLVPKEEETIWRWEVPRTYSSRTHLKRKVLIWSQNVN